MNYDLLLELYSKLNDYDKETLDEIYAFFKDIAVKPGQIIIHDSGIEPDKYLVVSANNYSNGDLGTISINQKDKKEIIRIDLMRDKDVVTDFLEIQGNRATIRAFYDSGCYFIEMQYDPRTNVITKLLSYYDEEALDFAYSNFDGFRPITREFFELNGINPDYTLPYPNLTSNNYIFGIYGFYYTVRQEFKNLSDRVKEVENQISKLKLDN
jgi:hypothetical protein